MSWHPERFAVLLEDAWPTRAELAALADAATRGTLRQARAHGARYDGLGAEWTHPGLAQLPDVDDVREDRR